MTLFVKVDPSIFIRDQPTCDNRLLLHHHKQHSSSEYGARVRVCECVRVCVLACTVYLTKKHFCVDATNEHVSAVVDSDGCPQRIVVRRCSTLPQCLSPWSLRTASAAAPAPSDRM